MDEAGRKKLWEEYAKSKSSEVREKIILEYAPLVKLVAGRLSMYLGYNVEYEDLVSYGIFGLIDAIDKFDALKDVKFETYASLRIRGAILDQIRKMDWIPRTIRQKQKKIDAVIREFETKYGRNATDEEIAESLGITSDEYVDWQSQMKVTNVVSLNEFMEQGSEIPNDSSSHSTQFDGPEEVIEKEELKRILAEALELLTEKERKVIVLYYYEDLTLKEISSILEVSESRISQLHTRALQKMKTKLGNYMGILTDKN
ncbi:MAG: FliA/WhiG family RNA polymerase sigma factor [Lachnospiraceae bacterium]|nr:FliA/WhiG family RNA polymerase sigma factor [Lachnospiraceae bacterium]